jgi:polygalacturonase
MLAAICTAALVGFVPEQPNITSYFDITDYGAVEGGHDICTTSFHKAVAAAASSAAGNGGLAAVVVPAGVFLSGAFSLSSSVFLKLARGSELRASNKVEDYPKEGWDWDPALIDTHNATNTGIIGEGTLNGQALPLWVDHYSNVTGFVPIKWEGVYGCTGGECRPKLVRFTDCAHVTVIGITSTNSPDWNSLYRRCNNVAIDSVKLLGNHQWPNNDGIDFESGTNISVTRCTIDVADDGLVFSAGNTNPLRVPWPSGPVAPVQSVVVRDCSIRSKSSAIKFSAIGFGALTNHSDMHGMRFENITIHDSSRGIGFQQRTGSGSIYNISFDNISIETKYPTGPNWWGSGEGIWITSLRQGPSPKDALTGTVHDIRFSNIVARSENGILVSGHGVNNIQFANLSITVATLGNTTCSKGDKTAPHGCRDYRPMDPQNGSVVPCQTSAIYLEGAGSVTFDGSSARFEGTKQSWWSKSVCTSSGKWNIMSDQGTAFKCNHA